MPLAPADVGEHGISLGEEWLQQKRGHFTTKIRQSTVLLYS